MMNLMEVIERAKQELKVVTNLEVSNVVGISRTEEAGWLVTVELIERKSIPDTQDIIGTYNVIYNGNGGGMTGYERTRVHRRMDSELIAI
jgi:hypothetical protein